MKYSKYIDEYVDETTQVYMGFREGNEIDLSEFDNEGLNVVIQDGKAIHYVIRGEEIIYIDGLGKEIELLSNKPIELLKTKGHVMSTDYTETIKNYGIQSNIIEQFKERGCAYKPHSFYEGKMYVGSYLMIDKAGNPFTVLETTFKGDLQKSALNVHTLGFYDLAELEKLGDVQLIKSYERKIQMSSTSVDELFEDNVAEQTHTIHIYKITIGNVEAVLFFNETTKESNGAKLWNVYLAEQQLRNKPKNLDDLFEDNLKKEIDDMHINDDDQHVNGDDLSKYAPEEN